MDVLSQSPQRAHTHINTDICTDTTAHTNSLPPFYAPVSLQLSLPSVVITACHGALPSNTGKVMCLTLACNLFGEKKSKCFYCPKLNLCRGTCSSKYISCSSVIQIRLTAQRGRWQLYVFFFNTDLTSLNQPVVWCLKIGLFILILKNV